MYINISMLRETREREREKQEMATKQKKEEKVKFNERNEEGGRHSIDRWKWWPSLKECNYMFVYFIMMAECAVCSACTSLSNFILKNNSSLAIVVVWRWMES